MTDIMGLIACIGATARAKIVSVTAYVAVSAKWTLRTILKKRLLLIIP